MPISICNSFDGSLPSLFTYCTRPEIQPCAKMVTDLDPGFLLGCSCSGSGCTDPGSCSCVQLTLSPFQQDDPDVPKEKVGYQHGRLPDVVLTGIYECNRNCSCSSRCENRVVQLPIRAKLQVFKTASTGWGVRTLVDLPQGTFVCTYVGKLYAKAEECGYDDAYFAEQDLIEVAEDYKEGYESDVEPDSGDEEFVGTNMKRKEMSARQLFNSDDNECFIIDGMDVANVGRFLNHSCSPNIFVQNVFVESHDLRMPTMAFFTQRYVRAGTELVWNYNYKVGQVPEKRIDCGCGAKNCKGRLL